MVKFRKAEQEEYSVCSTYRGRVREHLSDQTEARFVDNLVHGKQHEHLGSSFNMMWKVPRVGCLQRTCWSVRKLHCGLESLAACLVDELLLTFSVVAFVVLFVL